MYVTKEVKNFKKLRNIKNVSTTQTRLFHETLSLKFIELTPRENDMTGARNTLVPLLKSYRIGFLLNKDHIIFGFRRIRDLKTKAKYCKCL